MCETRHTGKLPLGLRFSGFFVLARNEEEEEEQGTA